MATEVVMPQMGESIAEGTITRWLKKVGERVERDEPLFEISTDKVDAEIPSPAAGTLTQVLFKEGDTVEVNKVVAYIGDGDGAAAESSKQEAAAAAAPASQAAVSAPAPPQPPTLTQKPSAPQQQPTAPAPQQRSAAAPPQPMAPASPQQSPPTSPASPRGGTSVAQASGSPQTTAEGVPPADDSHGEHTAEERTAEELRRTRSSPLVRKIAAEHNIDISRLEGTGASGRVTKNDILSFIESGAATAPASPPQAIPSAAEAPTMRGPAQPTPLQPGEGDRVEPMTVMRKKIAEHMTMSQRTSAHVATVYEIDMTRVQRLRERHKAEFQQRVGTKLSYMPFIFQAITQAIRQFPIFNSQAAGDQIIYKRDINLGMAVALDWGLIVPVIKRADDLSIAGLAKAANDLAERARAKQLKPDEVAGGTFTITNPGVFGGLFGTPIINQPQVAILGVGTIEKRAKVITTEEGDDVIAIRHMAYFALSFDHRIIDVADAERFLSYVKELLEAGQFLV
jgi:2-oxoglutarate dehydrogenase E2 component (dihydrolipoamide succinyltransferase)